MFQDGKYLENDTPYRAASGIAKIDGLEWGGDWKTFPDAPQYQVNSAGRSVTQARGVFEAGGR